MCLQVGRGTNLEAADSFTDIRYDEDYAAFYELNADKCSLPPPVDGNVLYKDMTTYLTAQQYKDPASGFHFAGPQYVRGPNPFASLGGQSSIRSGISDLYQRPVLRFVGLETVQETQYERKPTVDEHLAEALSQLQLGNEIQRPGSQPAPNLLQGEIPPPVADFIV